MNSVHVVLRICAFDAQKKVIVAFHDAHEARQYCTEQLQNLRKQQGFNTMEIYAYEIEQIELR